MGTVREAGISPSFVSKSTCHPVIDGTIWLCIIMEQGCKTCRKQDNLRLYKASSGFRVAELTAEKVTLQRRVSHKNAKMQSAMSLMAYFSDLMKAIKKK